MERTKRGKYMLGGKHIIDTSTVFQRGKTHIPISVRDMLDLAEGDKVIWIFEGGRIYLESSISRL